jgi:hypothetical protein
MANIKDGQVAKLMTRLFTMAADRPDVSVEVVLEFLGLRPPYRLVLAAGESLGEKDPRRKVFEAQLTYILNTGGLMFVLTPLPFKSVRAGTAGGQITKSSGSVSAVRFHSGRWFPVPADQIEALFERPPESATNTLWLFREFPLF